VDVATTVLAGAEIKALYEAESNTNTFTDAEQTKLGHLTVTQAVDLDQLETDIAALSDGMVYKGNWDASAGTFPGAGAAQTGWFYYVSVAGTVDNMEFAVGDNLVATTDTASTTIFAGNWSKHDQTPSIVEEIDYDTKADLQANNVAPDINLVRIAGYTSVGDGGGASYKRVGSEPPHAGKVQSSDGTWWELLETTVTPQMFGAVADGTTDDTIAIQAAIDYAESLVVNFTRGATVLLPPGGYFLSSTLTINSNQITIQGYGQASMLIRTANYGNLFTIVGPDPDNAKIIGIQLRDFYVLCKTNAVTTGALIDVTRASRMYISNVSLQDGFIGIHLNGCDNVWMTDVDIQSGQNYVALQSGSSNIRIDPWDNASAIRSQCSNIYMDNIQLKTDESDGFVEHALLVSGVDGLYIANSHLGFAKYAIRLRPFDNVANIQHIHFTNSYIDGNVEQSDYLLFVEDALTSPPHTGILENVTFTNCGFIRPDLQCIVIISDTAEKFIFDSCTFDGGNADCLQVNGGGALSNSIFSSCIFDNWNRNGGSAWELRFLAGNMSHNIQFSACQFLSSLVNENAAFAGSENDIRFNNCKFSKTSFGGTTSGKNLRNVNASGMTDDLSENHGVDSVTVDANAQGSISHGLNDIPTVAVVGLRADTTFDVQVTAVGTETISVRVRNSAGADVVPATFTVQWMAKV
jgi:hypothetical protein